MVSWGRRFGFRMRIVGRRVADGMRQSLSYMNNDGYGGGG